MLRLVRRLVSRRTTAPSRNSNIKIGEESIELIIAAKGQGNDRLISEIADLTYHMLVLLAAKGLTTGDILTELERRHQ